MIHVVILTYKAPLSVIEAHVVAHRAYLDAHYEKGNFLVSGPQEPRTGGVILAKGITKDALIQVMESDPFILHGLSDYEITSFSPNKAHFSLKTSFMDYAD